MARASKSNTKVHSIFLIDTLKLMKATASPHASIEDAISYLMMWDEEYTEQALKDGIDTSPFAVRLYFRKEESDQTRLGRFCSAFIAEGEEVVTFQQRTSSSVLFIWSDKHLFAVTTGQGYRMVENYSVPKFGMIVTSIFEDKFKVTSLDSNALASIVHSARTVYANEIDFIDIEALDTIFKEVTGRLNDKEQVHSILNLEPTAKKSSLKIKAKNYVQFSSALDFVGLLHLIAILDKTDFTQLADRFNLISPLDSKRDKKNYEANIHAVVQKIYEAVSAGNPIPFDIFHKNSAAFIDAEEYILYERGIPEPYATGEDTIESAELYSCYRKYLGDNQDSLAAFSTFIWNIRIKAVSGESVVTDGTFIQHLSGEIESDGKNYYIFYGEFYYLNSAYSERLNEALKAKFRDEYITKEIQTVWLTDDEYDEDWFNENASLENNFVHLHKVKPGGIEFADLIGYEDGVMTVVHVKDGFDSEMRALDRQVELSLTKIMDIKNNNNNAYMKQLYQNALKHTVGVNISTVFPTESDFISAVRDSVIRYVIVIRPTNKDLLKNRSHIAKHCLNALIVRCFNQGFELKIQIK